MLIHDQKKLKAKRRLYMTATQRVYTPAAKSKAGAKNIGVYSMDDENLYGPIIFEMKFGEAVNNNLLSDYEVVVIAYNADQIHDLQNHYTSQTGHDIKTDDWVDMIGLWDALASPTTEGLVAGRPSGAVDPNHCRRGIVFSNSIRKSKMIAEHWQPMVQTFIDNQPSSTQAQLDFLGLDVKHIDGQMNAFERHERLRWLKAKDIGTSNARLITNARCLQEGVDVPSLDAVLFAAPRSSEIDIVQSVGRVMRKAEGKQIGYIILPVTVPNNKTLYSHEYLNSSAFSTVWKVLRALRSHDERLDTNVNSVHLATKTPITLIDRTGNPKPESEERLQNDEQLAFSAFKETVVASAIVKNVGDRQYWPTWGRRVGEISQNIEGRILELVGSRLELKDAYDRFSKEIANTLKTEIQSQYLAAMVAQHIVTIPVFDALFGEDRFSACNPISLAIDDFISEIDRTLGQNKALAVETEDLRLFYQRMKHQIAQIDNPKARLEVLKSLYESFFKYVMPKETTKLGVVYTPTELVDFMIRFVDSICRDSFGRDAGISEAGVNILDPFTGTGTFIYRLITATAKDSQEFLIRDDDLGRKFRYELQAKEILLLAYYIANLKIEEGYRERMPDSEEYVEFKGSTFTDTFKEAKTSQESFDFQYLKHNDERVRIKTKFQFKS